MRRAMQQRERSVAWYNEGGNGETCGALGEPLHAHSHCVAENRDGRGTESYRSADRPRENSNCPSGENVIIVGTSFHNIPSIVTVPGQELHCNV